MTLFFNSDEITIYRRRQIGGTNRFTMSATFTAYRADIQPASEQRQEMGEGRFGAVFTAFVEYDVDIKENDQILTSEGKRYSVKGVQRWQDAGILDHIELLLTSVDG